MGRSTAQPRSCSPQSASLATRSVPVGMPNRTQDRTLSYREGNLKILAEGDTGTVGTYGEMGGTLFLKGTGAGASVSWGKYSLVG